LSINNLNLYAQFDCNLGGYRKPPLIYKWRIDLLLWHLAKKPTLIFCKQSAQAGGGPKCRLCNWL